MSNYVSSKRSEGQWRAVEVWLGVPSVPYDWLASGFRKIRNKVYQRCIDTGESNSERLVLDLLELFPADLFRLRSIERLETDSEKQRSIMSGLRLSRESRDIGSQKEILQRF